ncbi:MAG: hypothetical protein GY874_04075 [Desulfobacteraceae bacterium]|nr:hypothetical protein [Desulfobacteraceae bacterium]
MDFKKHLETAWNLTLKNIVPLVLMTIVMLAVGILTLGILLPVMMAGFMQAVISMIQNQRQPQVQDLFSQMQLFLPLLVFYIVAGIAIMIGIIMLVLPGLIISLGISFACLFMLPLMTDKDMAIVDAIKQSWQMAVNDNVPEHLVTTILFLSLMAIGKLVFLAGILFTLPFAIVFLMSVYLEKCQANTAAATQTQPPPPSDK